MRREDQDQISEFGRLNNRLLEVRAELKQYKSDVEKLDDATAELAMNSADGKVMILIGESFVECTEEFADECEYNRMTFPEFVRAFIGSHNTLLLCRLRKEKRTFTRCDQKIDRRGNHYFQTAR